MQFDQQRLLRGLAKLVAVVVAAALGGTVIGIGLAELSGNDETGAPIAPAGTGTSASAGSTTPTTRATTTTPSTSTSTSTTATGTPRVYRVPRVQVQSALLGPISSSTGRAVVTVRVRVTNRGSRPLTMKTPALVSDADEVPLSANRRAAAGRLLRPIAPGSTAAGVLRFTVSGAVAQRLTANSAARLRVANRTRVIELTTNPPPG